MIRIVIAEDQALVLGALAALLDMEPDLEVVGRAADGQRALELVLALQPDVLVSDVEMPGISGIEVAARLRADRSPVHVLIVTTFGRAGYLRRALEAGVRGYLLKDVPSAELASAVRTIAAGGKAISPHLAEAVWGYARRSSQRARAGDLAACGRGPLQPSHSLSPRSLHGHGPQLPFRSGAEARGGQPDRSRPDRPLQRLALAIREDPG